MCFDNYVFFGPHKGNDYFSLLMRNEEEKEQFFSFVKIINGTWNQSRERCLKMLISF